MSAETQRLVTAAERLDAQLQAANSDAEWPTALDFVTGILVETAKAVALLSEQVEALRTRVNAPLPIWEVRQVADYNHGSVYSVYKDDRFVMGGFHTREAGTAYISRMSQIPE